MNAYQQPQLRSSHRLIDIGFFLFLKLMNGPLDAWYSKKNFYQQDYMEIPEAIYNPTRYEAWGSVWGDDFQQRQKQGRFSSRLRGAGYPDGGETKNG